MNRLDEGGCSRQNVMHDIRGGASDAKSALKRKESGRSVVKVWIQKEDPCDVSRN